MEYNEPYNSAKTQNDLHSEPSDRLHGVFLLGLGWAHSYPNLHCTRKAIH